MAKIYRDADGSIEALSKATIAVIGYGNQGRAQALNMRDSGVRSVVIGNREDSYRNKAVQDGFPVYPIVDAVKKSDIVMILVPDEVQPQLFTESLEPNLKPGATLCFASGYNIAYHEISPAEEHDVIMVAPRMIGQAVRDRYMARDGFPAFIDVHQDHSGRAEVTALALAKAIGALRTGSIQVSFAQEAWMDLLTEQAVWPLIMKVLVSAFHAQVAEGLPPEAVLLELYLSKEPAEILDRAADIGLFEQLKLHSRTSQYGQLTAGSRLTNLPIDSFIQSTLKDRIMSGAFAHEWSREQVDGSQTLENLTQKLAQHPLTMAEHSYWAKMGGGQKGGSPQ